VRVVLDTNVIVSSYLSAQAPIATIRSHAADGTFTLVVSEQLLAEYEEVLNDERIAALHPMSRETVRAEVAKLRGFATVVALEEIPPVIQDDPDDDVVVTTAVAGEVEYIVTGDKHLRKLGQYQGIQILVPATFVSLLAP
jgi:uncharacterized protein